MTVVAQVPVLGNGCNSCCVSLLALSGCPSTECVSAPLPREESANFPKDHKLLCHTSHNRPSFLPGKIILVALKVGKTFKVVEDSNIRKSEEMKICSSVREKKIILCVEGRGCSQGPGPHRSSVISHHPTTAPFRSIRLLQLLMHLQDLLSRKIIFV